MMPTANQVAWAIVAACRETGDDPIAIASGASKGPAPRITLRARHYALHALLFVFPDLPKSKAAEMVGAPAKPAAFYNNSMNQIARIVSPATGRRMANWWDEEGFERVTVAIEAAGAPAPTPVDPEPLPSATSFAAPIKLSAAVGSIVEPFRPAASPGKRKLDDMLREAVANTARMTPPPDR